MPIFAVAETSVNMQTTVQNTTQNTTAGLSVPAAPTDLATASAPTQQGVYLKWNDNSSNEEYFAVQRQTGNESWVNLNNITHSDSYAVRTSDTSVTAGATYNYRVQACNSAGCSLYATLSGVLIPGSSGAASISPYQTSNIPAAPSDLVYTLRESTVHLKWKDNSSITNYFNVERYLGGAWSSMGRISSSDDTHGSYADRSVTTGASYAYRVQACREGYGCSAFTAPVHVSIPNLPDTTAPVLLNSALSGRVHSSDQINLYWTSATDNEAVKKYVVYRNNSRLAETTVPSYQDAGLAASTEYSYYVIAYDDAGNASNPCETRSFTTLTEETHNDDSSQVNLTITPVVQEPSTTPGTSADDTAKHENKIPSSTENETNQEKKISTDVSASTTIDHTPPLRPNYLKYDITAANHVKLYWGQASDKVGVAGYELYKNGTLLAKTADQQHEDNSVEPDTRYTYYVVAFDEAGNRSLRTSLTFTIPSPEENIERPSEPTDIPPSTPAEVTPIHAYLKAKVVTESGDMIPGVVAYITGEGIRKSGEVDGSGYHNFVLSAGKYSLSVILPPKRTDLVRPDSLSLSLITSKTQEAIFIVKKAAIERVVYGRVSLADGSVVNNAYINAFSSSGKWLKTETASDGAYSLRLANEDLWTLRIVPTDPGRSGWYSDEAKKVTFSGSVSENKEVNFTAKELGGSLKISLVDDQGYPVAGAGISLEPTKTNTSDRVTLFKKSDGSGVAEFNLPFGTFNVRAFLPPGSNLLNPKGQTVIVTKEPQQITLNFKNPEVAKITVYGQARLHGGNPASFAYISGWSNNGGVADTQTDGLGRFTFQSQPGDTWHISAALKIGDNTYKSAEIIIPVKNGYTRGDMDMVNIGIKTHAIEINSKSDGAALAVSDSGASVYVPPSSVSGTSGDVKIGVASTVEAPSRPDTHVIGPAYDFTMQDSDGFQISQFDNDLEITLPYTDGLLSQLGTNSNAVKPSYFDESTGAWVRVNDYTIDTVNHLVKLHTKHLTMFALVAPASVVPPTQPGKISASVPKAGIVSLKWTNPASNFHHVKIYRSESSKSIGKLINDLVPGQSYQDKGLKKKTYYYTLRSVDAYGNESKDSKKITVNAGKVTKKK